MNKIKIAIGTFAALCLFSSTAVGGSVTVTVVQGGQPTLTKTYTIADAELDRIRDAFRPQIAGTPTRPQIFQFWFDTFMGNTKATVLAFERQKAHEAVPDPTPINPQ